MLGVGAADVLLHGAVPLFLCSMSCYFECAGGKCRRGRTAWASEQDAEGALTPVQRLRQAEPS